VILYLDTSALVKLFVNEPHSDRVLRAASEARLVTTHAIAYVEACAAFARLASERRRKGLLSTLRRALDQQWPGWEIVGVTESLVRRAADLAGNHLLRGYDSPHLAAAESVHDVFRGSAPFQFAVFDERLNSAARGMGIPLIIAD
jgi:predicted nucleic acid-binding protein